MKVINTILLLTLPISICAKEELLKKLPVYGIVKPTQISTLVSVATGIIQALPYKLGDKVKIGKTLVEVLEKEGIRPYRNTINGQVAIVHVTKGGAVTPGRPLITVVNPSAKILEVSLSPQEANQIKEGLKVTHAGKETIMGHVSRVSPIVDPDKGSVTTFLQMADPQKVRIGEILALDIWPSKASSCDKVVKMKDLNAFTQKWKIKFISGNQACLIRGT